VAGVDDVGTTVEPVTGVEPAVAVVTGGTSVATVSLAIVNKNVELPPPCPSGWLTCHATAHSPFGSGFGTDTLSETPSSPTCGVPTAIGDPLHTTSTVFAAPSGVANVIDSVGGDDSTVLPAAGLDETIVLSAASTLVTENAPNATMPTNTARANAARARRMTRMGDKVLFMQVAQR
jgi:hypothetical protein